MERLKQKIDLGNGVTFGRVALAPMAGITDKPMRMLAKQFGATWAVSEMLSSDPSLWQTKKSQSRTDHIGETGVISVQIAGSQPQYLAQAAQFCVQMGAQVIDINMGCPAKKVCQVLAGSALLQNEPLVEKILQTVVRAVAVPVTLKTRLGWDDENQNILTVAKMAEHAGIKALAIHGRTRTQMYKGSASYDLIAKVKQSVGLPIWVNGDVASPQKAWEVLQQTGADGVMIGRGAQGQAWLFRDVVHYLEHGTLPPPISFAQAKQVVLEHLQAMHHFYGEATGVRMARKHMAWYVASLPDGEHFRKQFNLLDSAQAQVDSVSQFLERQTSSVWFSDYR